MTDSKPYLHYCYDWDGMLIDDSCPEFECCTCDFGDWDGSETQDPGDDDGPSVRDSKPRQETD